MLYTKRIMILAPEFSQALENQSVEVSSKIKSMSIMGAGNCKYVCTFDKDVLFPKDSLSITVNIDNTKCSKKIEKYKVKLIRRTQVFNTKTAKPIYTND